jgi:hypothetical protein
VDDFDPTGSIAIDLVRSGVGPKERNVDRVNDTGPGIFMFVYSASGTIRDAVPAGGVTVGGTDRTPLPSSQRTIERDVAHNVIAYR